MKKSVMRACLLILLAGAFSVQAAEPVVDPIHLHRNVPLPEGMTAPQVQAQLFPDAIDGFNLHIELRHFAMGPPQSAGKSDPGELEGHAHLYINGEKIQRVYGTDLHIPAKWLKEGINQLTVTLNSHDHDTWVVGDKPFLTTVFVDPDREQPVVHIFSSAPLE